MLAYWMVAVALLHFCSRNGVSGDFTATLVVFSGVRDPEWTIASSHPDYMEIQNRLDNAINKGWAYQREDLPSILGYKGILVESNIKSVSLIVGPTTVQLQTMLFNTMPKDALPDKLRKEISKVIASGKVTRQKAPKRNKRFAPPYGAFQVEHPWAQLGRQFTNNCYNYATTIRTDSFAAPGRGTGLMLYPPLTSLNVAVSALRDGLNALNVAPGGPAPVNPPLPNQNHMVALVVWPGYDFHWYRLDADGTWSHKPGQTAITKFDNAGNMINDPRNAAMAGYQFAGFFACNRNFVHII
ncbi:uncharacterized protein LOC144666727 [Oculina patagonica]